MPRFAWIIEQLGFTVVEGTGPWAVCAQTDHAAVMIYECPGYSPDLRVAADSRIELVRITEILSDNLELRGRPNSLRAPA